MPSASSMAGARPRIRVIVAVWGRRYIERFERYALASMLAPGNLPGLGAAADVELLILTARADIRHFRGLRLLKDAQRHVKLAFQAIDDLIVPGSYAVTLTLAFTRGVVSAGEAMTATSFIFWNADFVMSDGTLARVLASIRAGRRIVCAGSFRVDAEAGERFLDERVAAAEGGPLVLPAREIATLAMRHPHPTLLAMDMLRTDVASRAPAQMFWGDYAAGVCVARFHQVFMLCLTPTRPVGAINSYCDYAFLPEFCPAEPIEVIASSDEAFILEMQDFTGESELIEFRDPAAPRSEPLPREIARRTAVWATPEHLGAGETPVVFRARDDAATEQRLLAASARDHAAVRAALPAPVSHRGHHYWLSGVTDWLNARRTRALQGHHPDPPRPDELDLTLSTADIANLSGPRARAESDREMSRARRLARLVIGPDYAPRLPHPAGAFLRPVGRLLQAEVAATRQAADGRLLVVSPPDKAVFGMLAPLGAQGAWIETRHLRWWRLEGGSRFSRAVLVLPTSGPAELIAAYQAIAGALAEAAEVTLVLHQPMLEQTRGGDRSWERAGRLALLRFSQAVDMPAPPAVTAIHAPRGGRYARAVSDLARTVRARSAGRLVAGGLSLALAALLEQPWLPRRTGHVRALVCRFTRAGATPVAPAAVVAADALVAEPASP